MPVEASEGTGRARLYAHVTYPTLNYVIEQVLRYRRVDCRPTQQALLSGGSFLANSSIQKARIFFEEKKEEIVALICSNWYVKNGLLYNGLGRRKSKHCNTFLVLFCYHLLNNMSIRSIFNTIIFIITFKLAIVHFQRYNGLANKKQTVHYCINH